MTWSPPALLGGPVLYWELVRASRRPWAWVLRYGFLAWVVCQFVATFSEPPPERLPYLINSAVPAIALKADHQIKVAFSLVMPWSPWSTSSA